jgi:hypothetical protein
MDAVKSGDKSPIAAGFQFVEIRACLNGARSYCTEKKYKDSWIKFVYKATEAVNRNLRKLRDDAPELFRKAGPFAKYEQKLENYFKNSARD